jgi:ATPase subunit of ABC transporter with duplicated ATPase domains
MPHLRLRDISYVTPDGNPLFSGVDLAFGSEKTGLVGRNGAGKTTLLRLLTGAIRPQLGRIDREGTLRELRQEVAVDADRTVADAFDARQRLASLRRALDGVANADEIAAVDWTLDARIDAALRATGLPHVALDRPLRTFSGGERTRIALAALTFGDPDFIVLDEPTNNLDRDGRARVARLLAGFRGGAVVVSHDRELLGGMDRIVELSTLGVRIYGGGWDFYAEVRDQERAAADANLSRAEREASAAQRDAQRAREKQQKRDAAGRRARSRGDAPKMLMDARKQRAETTSARSGAIAERTASAARASVAAALQRIEPTGALSASMPSTGLPVGRTVLSLHAVTGGHDPHNPAVRDVSFDIVGPQRIAVTGPNGCGKTTLIALALGQLAPRSGRVVRPVDAALLDQHVAMLDRGDTILGNFRRLQPDEGDNACRSALARFLFRADAALRPVSRLSGGEMLRAGLACVLGGRRPPQLLILDEPTNHLDIASIEAVEAGLEGYDGALLIASHDEAFLANVGIERRIELGPDAPVR